MSREIKFRGKRIDNGEWNYGKVLEGNFDTFIVTMVNTINGQLFDVLGHAVIPETVGQFTGLKDKNGKEIYEKDICWTFGPGKDFQHEVVYKNGAFGYCVEHQGFISFAGNHNFYWDGKSEHIEVIGNVFDSPELLAQA